MEEEGFGAADEPEEAEGEEVKEDEGEDESSEESSSSEESGAEDEGADDEGPEDEEEGEEGVAAMPISKEQQEAEEEDLGKVSSLNCSHRKKAKRNRQFKLVGLEYSYDFID